MDLVLLVHAFMAAFLIVFQHKVESGSFGIGASRAVDSSAILVNPTYALAIYNSRLVLPGLPLEVECQGASKYESLTAVALSSTS